MRGMASLKHRARTLPELADAAVIYAVDAPLPMAPEAASLSTKDALAHLSDLTRTLQAHTQWDARSLEALVRDFAASRQPEPRKLGEVAQPLRIALTGSKVSPPIFEVMEILGRTETLARLAQAVPVFAPALDDKEA